MKNSDVCLQLVHVKATCTLPSVAGEMLSTPMMALQATHRTLPFRSNIRPTPFKQVGRMDKRTHGEFVVSNTAHLEGLFF